MGMDDIDQRREAGVDCDHAEHALNSFVVVVCIVVVVVDGDGDGD